MQYAVISFVFVTFVTNIIIIIRILISVHNNKANQIVKENSKKIQELSDLNSIQTFHDIPSSFSVSKHYDNKGNYNKIQPVFLMTATVRKNIDTYSKYAEKIFENREKMNIYEEQMRSILSKNQKIDYEVLKISETSFTKREEKILSEYKLTPVTDCAFNVKMTYSSPKHRVNLQKNATFNFNDLYTCLESVARSRLDKKTYKSLSYVERGEVSDSLRYNIFSRDRFRCVLCGASASQGARLHIDHIIPISKGGKSTPENLRTLCERCNIGKSNKIEISENSGGENTNETDTCSLCGGKLVLRNGKYGKFYGCSNYPKCNYTRNI